MAECIPQWLVEQFEERAAGSTIEINYSLSYVAIDLGNDQEYFFQGDEASDLLDEVPDNISADDYLLAISQNW